MGLARSQAPGDRRKEPLVGVVLLNYNNDRDTIDCLHSLERVKWSNLFVVIVDNASANDSVVRLRTAIAKNEMSIVLIENKQNLGFAAGNNIGIRECLKKGCQYVMVLNNDTVVEKGFLDPLVSFWEKEGKRKKIGALTGKILYYDRPTILWYAGGKGFIQLTRYRRIGEGEPETRHSRIREVKTFSGCFVLFSREILENVGLFDEDFFFGEEDIEYSYRLRKNGFRIYYIPDSKIWHKVGRTRNLSPAQIYNGYISGFLLAKKVLPPWRERIFRWCYKHFLLLTGWLRYKRKKDIAISCRTYYNILRKVIQDADTKNSLTEQDWKEINQKFGEEK